MKRMISILLAVLMLLTVAPLGVISFAEEVDNYEVGDHIQFGNYPQSEVKDEETLALLNKTEPDWKSYNYYSGNSSSGSMVSSDYMKYSDVTVDGLKYRAVCFTKYRPWNTRDEYADAEYYQDEGGEYPNNSYQDENGYYMNTVYWFKFEPITWRVLDPYTGLVMSENILDSQAYNNYIVAGDGNFYGDPEKTYFASDYAESSIRDWLNNDFYNTAFTSSQKNNIETTHLTTKSTDNNTTYDSPDTDDKMFLLTYADTLKTSYGFSSKVNVGAARKTVGSDYAKAQGLYVDVTADNCSPWLLRSHRGSYSYDRVTSGGFVTYKHDVDHTDDGIRPAFRLNKLESDISTADDTPLMITGQPNSLTQAIGATAKFKVAAEGSGKLSYQWKVSTDGKNWTNSRMTGYNTSELSVPVKRDKDGYKFLCIVTDETGSVTSSIATLTVLKETAKITTQPISLTQAVGTTAKFTVAATGSGTLRYQWKVSTDGKKWTNSRMTGYNTDTLQVPVKYDKNGYKFLCVVTDASGSVTSNTAMLTVVKETAKITAQPDSLTQSVGSTAKFTVTATGSGTLKYQWRVSADGGKTWADSKMTGYNTPELSVPVKADKNGYQFLCIVKDANGKVKSNPATLTVA